MINKERVVALIKRSVIEQSPDAGEDIHDDAALFGDGGLLDSMGLVNVTLDVEQQINDDLGIDITIADDRAMSRKHSPFRTIGSLADYVIELIHESDGVGTK
jgi:acyl carrier protein